MSSHIASASEQHESVVEEINKHVVSINDRTQENAEAISESSSAGRELAQLSVHMNELVSKFKIA